MPVSFYPPPVVLCDIDGVIANLHGEWIARYNADYSDTLSVEDIFSWDISKCVKPECGNTIFQYMEQPGLYQSVTVIAGGLNGINAIRAAGCRVVFVTSTNKHLSGEKLQWLADHGFLTLESGGSSRDYVEAADKGLIRGDVMIDDYPKNVDAFRSFGPDRKCILYDQPWNRDRCDFVRARCWEEIPDLLANYRGPEGV